MSFTLTQYKQFLRDYDFDNNGSRGDRIYLKIANDSLRELYATGEFDFAEREGRLAFAALYNTGTVSITAGATAVTGASTVFTAAMIGRYIRFNGESQQYLITARGGNTSITISEAYLGASDLSAVTYQITDERVAAPNTSEPFRAVKRMLVDSGSSNAGPLYELYPCELKQLYTRRLFSRTAMIPRMYSLEWFYLASNPPVPYLWIHPPPDIKRVVTTFYSVWPIALSSGSDVCPIPYEAEGILREFGLAFLYREQGRSKEAQQQLFKAKGEARLGLAATRSMTDSNSRRPWFPEYDDHGVLGGREWGTIDPNTPMV